MKACLVATLACVTLPPLSASAGALDFSDIKDAPPEFLDTVESTLSEMTDELGISEFVVDVVVVGTYAYGIARPDDPLRQSDVDIVIYTTALSKVPTDYYAGFDAFRAAAIRYRVLLQERVGAAIDFDIKVDGRDVATHIADHDWVGYSLTHRVFYNRDDLQPRSVKGHFHQNVYYLFDRAAYQRFLADVVAHPRRIEYQRDGDQVVILDGAALDQGKRVELLRSFHKGAKAP